jgi:hypothetical protein
MLWIITTIEFHTAIESDIAGTNSNEGSKLLLLLLLFD